MGKWWMQGEARLIEAQNQVEAFRLYRDGVGQGAFAVCCDRACDALRYVRETNPQHLRELLAMKQEG